MEIIHLVKTNLEMAVRIHGGNHCQRFRGGSIRRRLVSKERDEEGDWATEVEALEAEK